MKNEWRATVQLRFGLGRIHRKAAGIFAALLVVLAVTSQSTAQDFASLKRDLASGADFRLRVGAALTLGKTHAKAALDPLVGALDDVNPAVRVAAAAALGVLGHREACDALRSRLAREPSEAVRTQIESAIAKLENAKGTAAPRVLVKVGELKNLTGARGERLAARFRGATRAKAAELPGVELISEASEGRSEAAARKLPLLVLDGVLNQLSQGADGQQTMVSAKVEYVFRKMPEHALTGSVTGTARALDMSNAVADQGRLAQLELEALEGAIESAMRGAPDVMRQALIR
jgi:hypothetical protein